MIQANDASPKAIIVRSRSYIPYNSRFNTCVTILLFAFNVTYDIIFLYKTNQFNYGFLGLCTVSFLQFIYLCLGDPGAIDNNKGKYTQQKLLSFADKMDEYCLECEMGKLPRSKHCYRCNRCISVYDHHCIWINNCIGVKNHRLFLSWLLMMLLTMVAQVLIIVWVLFIGTEYFGQDSQSLKYDNFSDSKQDSILVGAYLIIAVNGVLIIPLCVLIVVQVGNFCLNRTTYERFNKKKTLKDNQSNQKFGAQNCYAMCCLNIRDRRLIQPNKLSESLLDESSLVI